MLLIFGEEVVVYVVGWIDVGVYVCGMVVYVDLVCDIMVFWLLGVFNVGLWFNLVVIFECVVVEFDFYVWFLCVVWYYEYWIVN